MLRRAPLVPLAVTLLVGVLASCDDERVADAGPDAGAGIDSGPRADAGTDADTDAGPPTSDAGRDAGPSADAGSLDCPRTPAAADRARFVVVSHPFDSGGGQSDAYEVFALATDGTLSSTGDVFAMGRASSGRIAFTVDGQVGLVAQSDGSIGVFTLDAAGAATVRQAGYDPGFYATSIVADADGALYGLDAEFRASGGGVYRLEVDCEGRVARSTLVAAGRLPYGMAFLADGTAVVASKDLLDLELTEVMAPGPDVHLLDVETPTRIASADLFTETDWIGGGFALTANGRHAIVGDNSAFSSVPNRLGVAAIDGAAISAAQVVPDISDPVTVIASPFDDVILVASGFGDAIFTLAYDPDGAPPLSAPVELGYTARGPALPGSATMIERGALEGLVLMAENVAIRRLQFAGGGVVTDLGPFELGSGTDVIPGAIGVQP